MNSLDQIFVTLEHRLAALAPAGLQPIVSALLIIAAIMAVFGSCFALTTIMERKALGRMQNRRGPNRAGPCGLFQPLADALKMLTKEDIVPSSADKAAHFLAPLVLTVPIWLAFSLLPFGRNMTALELDCGALFFFALGSASELAVFMAGWSSQNKYSVLGAMRAIAQMISYEVPLVLATAPVLMLAGSLSLPDIVEAQGGYSLGFVPRWNILTPWGLAGFGLFLVAAAAESNRSPFDLPEGESELIAGYLTEYSGFKYALFFLGEYLGLFAITGLAVTLFVGGWRAPLPVLEWAPSWFWFGAKFSALIFIFIWTRGTLPRLRLDQLLNLAWKFLVPMGLIDMLAAALWHLSSQWGAVPGALPTRWLLGAALLGFPYVLLGRAVNPRIHAKREYVYVE